MRNKKDRNVTNQENNPGSSGSLITSEVKPAIEWEDFRPDQEEITSEISYKFLFLEGETQFKDGNETESVPVRINFEPVISDSYPEDGALYYIPGEVTFNSGQKLKGFSVFDGKNNEIPDFHVFFKGEKPISVIDDIQILEDKGIFRDESEFKIETYLDDDSVMYNNFLRKKLSSSEFHNSYIAPNDILKLDEESMKNFHDSGLNGGECERKINGYLWNNECGRYFVPAIVLFNNSSILPCLSFIDMSAHDYGVNTVSLFTQKEICEYKELIKQGFLPEDFAPVALYSPSLVKPGDVDNFIPQIHFTNTVVSNELSKKLYICDKGKSSTLFSNQLIPTMDLSLRYSESLETYYDSDAEIQITQNDEPVSFNEESLCYRLARIKLKNKMTFWGIVFYNPVGIVYDIWILKYHGFSSIILNRINISGKDLTHDDIYPLTVETAFATIKDNSFNLEFERWREIPNNDFDEFGNESLALLVKAEQEGKELKTWKY
jgi:hypothetical protein